MVVINFFFNFLFLMFFFSFFFIWSQIKKIIKRVPTTDQYYYKLFNQPNIILIQYPRFPSIACNLGTNSLIAFCNGVKSVAQSFHTAFIFVFNSASELSFYSFELTKVSSFYHCCNWGTSDSRLFGNFTRC